MDTFAIIESSSLKVGQPLAIIHMDVILAAVDFFLHLAPCWKT